MRLFVASLAAFVAFLHGWPPEVHAMDPDPPPDATATPPAEEPAAPDATATPPAEEPAAPNATATPPAEEPAAPESDASALQRPESCEQFTCGTTHDNQNCGECGPGEQCRWDGINGTAGTCVPGTYGEEIEEDAEDLAPPKSSPTPVTNLTGNSSGRSETSANFKSFAGSSVTLRNIASAISVDRDAEPTYNPYYGLSLGLAPRWGFLEKGFVAASFELDREITHSDDTTYEGEIVYSDIALAVGAGEFLELPLGVNLSGDLGITVPISKYSRARSLLLALKPGISISRSFPVLEGLTTSYSLRAAKYFHEFTTSQRDVPLIPQCNPEQADCDRFSNTGVRNASWQLSQAVSVGLDMPRGFGVQLSGAVITSFLYDWEKNDPRLSHQPQEPTSQRHLFAYGFEVYKELVSPLTLALGMSTVNPQLAPDSTFYAPFVNRYSTLYIDLHIDVVKLVTHSTHPE